MKKICIKCGAEFEAKKPNLNKTLCDDCAAKSANRTALRDRVCVDCGVHFVGYPRSMRCPDCNAIHKAKKAQEYEARRKMGATRQIGSVDYCQNCGKAYIVASGLQRYCPECAPVVTKEHERARSREWARENIDYEQRQQDRKAAVAEIPCPICGKMFKPQSGGTKTCSKECAAELEKRTTREWERNHSKDRNAYHNRLAQSKLAAMTDEERAEYREHTRARARENYRKQKGQENK